MTLRAVAVPLIFCALFAALPVSAQRSIPGIETSIILRMEPTYPAPNSDVRITAQSTAIDIATADTTWRVDDEVAAEGVGLRTLDIKTGAVGERTVVKVDVVTEFGTASAQIVVIPTEVDLLWESNSYTPALYRGRALPSAGTSLRLQAMPRFKDSSGKDIPSSALTFTWYKNGAPLLSVSGTGRATAVVPAPYLYGSDVFEVEAATHDEGLAARTSVRIASQEPVVTLYKEHPLFGTMYFEALGSRSTVPDEELSFSAIPYFAQVQSADSRELVYAWSVNGRAVAANTEKPSTITIDASNSDGIASIRLLLTHTTNLFLESVDNWVVTFANVIDSVDPFRPVQ